MQLCAQAVRAIAHTFPAVKRSEGCDEIGTICYPAIDGQHHSAAQPACCREGQQLIQQICSRCGNVLVLEAILNLVLAARSEHALTVKSANRTLRCEPTSCPPRHRASTYDHRAQLRHIACHMDTLSLECTAAILEALCMTASSQYREHTFGVLRRCWRSSLPLLLFPLRAPPGPPLLAFAAACPRCWLAAGASCAAGSVAIGRQRAPVALLAGCAAGRVLWRRGPALSLWSAAARLCCAVQLRAALLLCGAP